MYAMCYVQYVLCMLYTVCTMDVHLHTRLALPFFPCSALPCSDCLFCLVLPCLVCLPWFLSCLVLSGLFCPSYPVLSCPVCPVCPILSVLSSPVRPLLSCPSSSIRPLLVLSSSSPVLYPPSLSAIRTLAAHHSMGVVVSVWQVRLVPNSQSVALSCSK